MLTPQFAQGVAKGAGYGIVDTIRTNPRVSRFLRGLEADQVIGDFGLIQGAASGDEIDRLDYSLGTPRNAIIIATTKLAGGHSDAYMLFNEDTLFPMVNTTGTISDKIRSDIIFFEIPGGGAVFSVGSINWVGVSENWSSFRPLQKSFVSSNILYQQWLLPQYSFSSASTESNADFISYSRHWVGTPSTTMLQNLLPMCYMNLSSGESPGPNQSSIRCEILPT